MTSAELDRIAWRTSSYTGNSNCVEIGWRTSSYTGANGNCVEVALSKQAGVAVRDTKHRTGPVLAFATPQWRTFLAQLT
jgi:hypothetical protein